MKKQDHVEGGALLKPIWPGQSHRGSNLHKDTQDALHAAVLKGLICTQIMDTKYNLIKGMATVKLKKAVLNSR